MTSARACEFFGGELRSTPKELRRPPAAPPAREGWRRGRHVRIFVRTSGTLAMSSSSSTSIGDAVAHVATDAAVIATEAADVMAHVACAIGDVQRLDVGALAADAQAVLSDATEIVAEAGVLSQDAKPLKERWAGLCIVQ